MSLNKACIVFLAAIYTPLAAQAALVSSISCPPTITSHRTALIGARLFDGPPEELTELAPDHERAGTWDISGYKNSGRTLVLVCDYSKGKHRALHIPQTATSCVIRNHKTITASCR